MLPVFANAATHAVSNKMKKTTAIANTSPAFGRSRRSPSEIPQNRDGKTYTHAIKHSNARSNSRSTKCRFEQRAFYDRWCTIACFPFCIFVRSLQASMHEFMGGARRFPWPHFPIANVIAVRRRADLSNVHFTTGG